MTYVLKHFNGTSLGTIHSLENNGPGNKSVGREIIDVVFSDTTFSPPVDSFVVAGDALHLTKGQSFSVVGSGYSGTYSVSDSSGSPTGTTVGVLVGGNTHLPISAGITLPGFQVTAVSTGLNGTFGILNAQNGAYTFLPGLTFTLSGNSFAAANTIYTVQSATTAGSLTTVRVTGTVPVGTLPNGQVALQPAISNSFVAPTTINASGTNVFTVVYNIAQDYSSMLIPGTPVLIKGGSVDGTTTNYVATVTSAAYLAPTIAYPSGVTQVTTQYKTATSLSPVIITDASARMVFPMPAIPFGYLTYSSLTSLSPLSLVGKGVSQYNDTKPWGQALQENLVAMAEHYSGTSAPTAWLTGSLWHDTGSQALRFKSKDAFNIVGVIVGSSGTQRWSVDALQVNVGAVGDKVVVYNNASYPTAQQFTIASLSSTATPATSSGQTTHIVVTEAVDVSASTVGPNSTAPYGQLYNKNQMQGVVVPGLPVTGDVNMNSWHITSLANPVNNNDAVNLGFADGRYVNVTGDTMSGTLTLGSDLIFDALGAGNLKVNGTGSISVAKGNVTLGPTTTNAVVLTNNGTAAPTITFNTTTASTTTGNAVVNLGGNKITNSSIPTVATDLVTKQYVDDRVNGIIWITPILDPNLFADNLSTPPVVAAGDTLIPYHRTYIVNGTGTGAWTGFNGHAMYYDAASSSWKSVLGRAVAVGDRFGVYIEPDDDDTLAVPTSGGLTGQAGKIATVATVSPYTYTFYTPAEPDAISVRGNSTGSSVHMGHSYTFRGTWGTGSYGTNYRWIEFSGPQMLIDGAGLRYTANILNVGAGTGITVTADTVALDTTFGDTRYVTKAASSTLSAGVSITYAGGGEVLGLPATPTTAGSATSKAYTDGTFVSKIASTALTAGVNITFAGTGEVLGLPATPTTGGSATSKTYTDGTFVSKVASTALTSNVSITFSGTGEVLGLPATPTTGGSATSKTYTDGTFVSKIASTALSSNVNLTFSGTGEVLGLPATPTTLGSATSKSYVDAQDLASKGLVVNSQSAAYTLALADANNLIYHPPADVTARTWTIPANATIAFPVGTQIIFDNDAGAGVITIAITTDTLVLVGAGTTGSRTLAAGGQATAIKVSATRWRISGTGLT